MIALLIGALVLSGGGAWAAATIGAKDIKNDAVRSKHIKNGQVKKADLGAGSVNAAKVADGSLTGVDVADDSLTGADINESTLVLPPSGAAGGDLTGTYPNPTIGTGKVTSAKVADNSLTGTDIDETSLAGVNASALGGKPASDFASSEVYKRESAVGAGTDLGDGSFSIAQACDPGDILISGGPANVSATSHMVESFPTPGSTNSWTARIYKAGLTDNFSVVVLCLNQTP